MSKFKKTTGTKNYNSIAFPTYMQNLRKVIAIIKASKQK